MYTIDDIQIFIATHNRANLIVESLESILNQTAGVKEITVLDNDSTDNTYEVVSKYADRGVKYIKTYGFLGNFNKAQEIANKEFVMLFHDDDILHPKYIELAINLLNKENNLSIITTRYTEFKNNNVPTISQEISDKVYIFKDQKEFAEFLYYKEIVAYATAIYKTKYFKICPIEYEKYSKFNDWPFMVKIAKYGKSAIFADLNMFYIRKHCGQDTCTSTNTPSIEQSINWDLFFKKALKVDKSAKNFFRFKNYYKHFLYSKYVDYISQEDREKYSMQDVVNIAKFKGIEYFNRRIILCLYVLFYTLKIYLKIKI